MKKKISCQDHCGSQGIGRQADDSGLRISVEQIIKALANNIPAKELLEEYPELEPEDIQAALLYAAEIISEERVFQLK